jgi:beta-N-acetylhexosaminidase
MLKNSCYILVLIGLITFFQVTKGLAFSYEGNNEPIDNNFPNSSKTKEYRKTQLRWADSILGTMTLAEKVGQLFMVSAYSNRSVAHRDEIEKLITQYHIGGLCFFQGGPSRQLQLTSYFQNLAKIKLLISMDAEHGLGMRLDSARSFPRQMTYGAIKGQDEIYQLGAEMAWQCRRMGVHISFSPVIDVNSNPANPVIGNRSFGASVNKVTEKGIAYMEGLQDNGIIACAKHFPGHGDASTDSHETLPTISRSKQQLEDVEIKPFRSLIDNGIMGVMSAHLYLPALDTTHNRPSSVSTKVVTDLLRKELNFGGLAFTDALNMKGAANYLKPGELELLALKAGNDVLLCPENVPVAVAFILDAIATGRYTENELNIHVQRVLLTKYWAGLNRFRLGNTNHLQLDLNLPETDAYMEEVFAKAATLVKNENNLVPIKQLDNEKFASISLNGTLNTSFQQMLDNYAPFQHFNTGKEITLAQADTLLAQLAGYSTVIVGFHGIVSKASTNYNIKESALAFLARLQKQHKMVIAVFGNAYSLKNFKEYPVVLSMYEDNAFSNSIAAQIIFGALPAVGTLPVEVSKDLHIGTGITTQALERLSYRHPSTVAMNPMILDSLEDMALKTIRAGITPGIQVLVAREGKVVYNKAFGSKSYNSISKVNTKTNYDLASITKIAATLLVIEQLSTNNLVNISNSLVFYLPYLVNTDKASITLKQLLEHRAGLQPFMPFYKRTLNEEGYPSDKWYSPERNFVFNTAISSKLFGITALPDSLRSWVVASPRLNKLPDGSYPYKYSDLSFYFLQQVAEAVIKEPIDQYLQRVFYKKLGTYTLKYRPTETSVDTNIAPTEVDTIFRREWLRGTVHDPLAAMQGGVGGNAGLFGTANDVAKIMQLHLNNGTYGGLNYLSSEVIQQFIQLQNDGTYRGLGWDKPPIPNVNGSTSSMASSETFGHTGFTGTCVWADPKYKLIFVFLSNRICPDANNKKLIELSIRPRMMDIVYRSLWDSYPIVQASGFKREFMPKP